MEYPFEIKNIQGLSMAEAVVRLKTDGFNELPSDKQQSFLSILWHIISEPMFLLLLAGAGLYFLLGSKEEALMLLSFVLVMISITLYQERKSEHALLALKNLSSPRAFVIRDGQGKRIAGREVVVHDIIVVNEGDCVPADAKLLSSENLLVDESVLTGESLPVTKTENVSVIYSGTSVVQGRGIAQVVATGEKTSIGKIGQSLSSLEIEKTNLQKESAVLVKNFAIAGACLCTLSAVVYGLTRHDWLHGFLASIALAMAILPEELPVVLTIFLAIGAWRMSLKKVLTRRAPAIEALGATTVLCSDKTGTITQNRMEVKKIFVQGEFYQPNGSCTLPEKFHPLIEFSILASQRDPFDPTEIAIRKFGECALSCTEHWHNDWELVRQYPLSKHLLAISLVWQSKTNEYYVIAAKGAPEAIFDLCHLDIETSQSLTEKVQLMAEEGYRVLGVAKAQFQHQQELPIEQHDFHFEFLGLIGLADPIRPQMEEAIEQCHNAGMRVIMITGDHVGTAKNIARQIGLRDMDQVITGPELLKMSDEELAQKIKTTNIFARTLPEHKLRIVQALKANGEVVAMTGDGINDAPALKAAHIGIAMGARGTDVARESAALVLLDDDFSSIVSAVEMGRRIFDNIKKTVIYLLGVHLPVLGMSLLPVLFQWPLMLLPVHIVFLELIIDPTCSIVFEAEPGEADIMQRPPRSPNESAFNRKTAWSGCLQGLCILAIAIGAFLFGRLLGYSEAQLRALIFMMLVIENIALIFANRTRTKSLMGIFTERNPALWWIVGGSLIFIASVLFVPFLRQPFGFGSLPIITVLSSLCVCIASIFVLRKCR